MDKVFFEDNGMRLLQRALDLSVQKQGLISGNLANVDTPGYKTVDLNFDEELKRAIAEPASTSAVVPNVELVSGLPMRNDLNNVNIDREMAQVSTNALKFSMAAQLLAGKFRTLKSAITEGR